MKKLWVSVGLLAIIVGFCTWSTLRVDRISRDAAELLEQAETRCTLGDYDGAEALVYQSQRLWEGHEGFLGMCLRHTESDDVSALYPPLLGVCRARDQEEFLSRSLELRANLRMLSRMELPYYFNIL